MGLPEEIAPMRMQYYEDKRRVYTLQLEDAIKNGIIEAIKTTKNETLPVVRQFTAMNRTVGGTNRPSHHLRGASVPPKTAISKHAMDFIHDYGLTSPTCIMPPEIALRDPLDKEFTLNRKMAKKHFERSLRDQMETNKSMFQTEREKWTHNLCAKETKKEKLIAALRKKEQQEIQARFHDLRVK